MTNEKPPVPTQASEAVDKGVALASGEDASPPDELDTICTFSRAELVCLYKAASYTYSRVAADRWIGEAQVQGEALGEALNECRRVLEREGWLADADPRVAAHQTRSRTNRVDDYDEAPDANEIRSAYP